MMEVQSVLFPREEFTMNEAIQWLKDHKYKHKKVDTTEMMYRFRQHDPNDFTRMRTIRLHNDVRLIIGVKVA